MARCDTTKVKATNAGGRLFSVVHNEDLLNGNLGFIGDYATGETEIRKFVKPTTEIIAKEMPILIMKPEINYEQYTQSQKRLTLFVNKANKATVGVPLEVNDEFEVSKDLISGTPAKDQYVVLENDSVKLKATDTLPTTEKFYGVVTEIRKGLIDNFVDGTGNYTSPAYDMVHILVKSN